jgi:hypothetical protein
MIIPVRNCMDVYSIWIKSECFQLYFIPGEARNWHFYTNGKSELLWNPLKLCRNCLFVFLKNRFIQLIRYIEKYFPFIHNSLTLSLPQSMWSKPPFSLIMAFTCLFHWLMDDRVICCVTRGHTFSFLCCNNWRNWKASLHLLLRLISNTVAKQI